MLRVTLRSLLARKLRLLLSGVAIVLGVAFVSGTFVLTDTLGRVFEDLFTDVNKGIAVTVQGESALGGGGTADREPVPDAVVTAVRRVDGVADAIGVVSGYAQVVDKNGKAYKTGGAPSFGVSFHPDSPQESLRVRQGRAPRGPGEVAVDSVTFRRADLALNDQIRVLLKGPARSVTLVGVVELDKAPSLGGASLIAFDAAIAQEALGTPGTWTAVTVAAKPGVDQTLLRDAIAMVLPKGFEALTQKQAVDDASKELKEALGFFNTALLVFAAVALFVGAFLIFNTFSMLVAQRVRELALMRALGASRSQVTRSVLAEAVVVGLISSVLGFGLGIAVAIGLKSLLASLGIELPAGATVIQLRTFLVSLGVGVGVTAVAALVPSRRAARVAPVQAMRDSGPAEDRSLRRRTAVGSVVLLAGTVSLFLGLSDGELRLVGLGAALSFLGVAVLSALFARPAVGLIGLPLTRLGVPSRLGRGNAMRSPRRTSATAAALMIGLALVAMVSTFGASTKASVDVIVNDALGADYVLHTDTFQPFSPEVARVLEGKPELAQVAAYRFGRASVDGDTTDVQGVESEPLRATLKMKVLHGDLSSIDRGQMALSETFASARSLKVGQTVAVTWSRTGDQKMVIGAIYEDNQFAGNVLVGGATHDANVTEKLLLVVAVKVAEGVSAEASRGIVEKAVAAFPNVDVEDQAELVQFQKDQIDQLLNIVTVLLVFSVIIAVLGIVNTLALSVVERTRELGLLRAVGLQRRQLRRMIRAESVVIAIFGAVLGVAVGLCLGAALVAALKDQGITEFAVPVARLLGLFVAAGVAGVIAAALPARRAARLDVLQAIATE
jgi:putative ABC transport system permease protein